MATTIPTTLKTSREKRAYQLGQIAFRKGIAVAVNPYHLFSETSNDMLTRWYDGWYDAKFYHKYSDLLWKPRC